MRSTGVGVDVLTLVSHILFPSNEWRRCDECATFVHCSGKISVPCIERRRSCASVCAAAPLRGVHVSVCESFSACRVSSFSSFPQQEQNTDETTPIDVTIFSLTLRSSRLPPSPLSSFSVSLSRACLLNCDASFDILIYGLELVWALTCGGRDRRKPLSRAAMRSNNQSQSFRGRYNSINRPRDGGASIEMS